MDNALPRISACLVVYNEEKIIERCLRSIAGLAGEIIIIHDGECTDQTLVIAKKYTNKIFVREHIGEAEPHRAFSLSQATGEWILQIDADEFLNENDHNRIREIIKNSPPEINGYIFKWEMWNGEKATYFKGLQKMCLFRKNNFHYIGVPHEAGHVDGKAVLVDIFLHHRPAYNNIAWKSFLKKKGKWVPIHAKYFFTEQIIPNCFQADPAIWVEFSKKIRKKIWLYIVWIPIKNLLAQLRNGLWSSWTGINIAFQQYVYYLNLYLEIRKMEKR